MPEYQNKTEMANLREGSRSNLYLLCMSQKGWEGFLWIAVTSRKLVEFMLSWSHAPCGAYCIKYINRLSSKRIWYKLSLLWRRLQKTKQNKSTWCNLTELWKYILGHPKITWCPTRKCNSNDIKIHRLNTTLVVFTQFPLF